MSIHDLILELQMIQFEHGDIDVAIYDPEFSVHDPVNDVRIEEPITGQHVFGSEKVVCLGTVW